MVEYRLQQLWHASKHFVGSTICLLLMISMDFAMSDRQTYRHCLDFQSARVEGRLSRTGRSILVLRCRKTVAYLGITPCTVDNVSQTSKPEVG